MKCIKRKYAITIERVSDDIAAQLVSQGHADYQPKSAFKQQQRQDALERVCKGDVK